MPQVNAALSTGLPSLDEALRGLITGDNIVWQVEDVAHYAPFVNAFVTSVLARGRPLVYFRFADLPPLITDNPLVEIRHLDPGEGFEHFVLAVHETIDLMGREACYVFDCLSDLVADWYSDTMLGNFFQLTCPYLYDVEALGYFALIRNRHSFRATTPIPAVAQVVLDVYFNRGKYYVHPLKVQQRHSLTMHMLHVWDGDEFRPVRESAVVSEVRTSTSRITLEPAHHRIGVWHQFFDEAERELEASERGQTDSGHLEATFTRLMRMAISRDERIMALVRRYMSLRDILDIARRIVGTGLIGGKAVGMLLARAILQRTDAGWENLLEQHDSFFVGSDVFYTFIVRNGIWWTRQKQREPEGFLKNAEQARQRILMGTFPDFIRDQFQQMLDYFGQSPIIVRSSSLLEDNFGNAFAGKYESVFCANQGFREKRLMDFLSAVRTIYASSMSEKALRYRHERGLLARDEQMALLVQRVSGQMNEHFFYPHLAGVAFSYNPYVWHDSIDPRAGMVRLVFGLGTRAVDRSDDDYTRIVAVNAPERRPESNAREVWEYAQNKVDLLDLQANQLRSVHFADVVQRNPQLPLTWFASQDHHHARALREQGDRVTPARQVLTFNRLLKESAFVPEIRQMLQILEEAYETPVDVEFAANLAPDGFHTINVLQCRPLHVQGGEAAPPLPESLPPEHRLLEGHGALIGQSRKIKLDTLVYVSPADYAGLPLRDRYSIARLIGNLLQAMHAKASPALALLGPGRWGTASPELGIPVLFNEIRQAQVLCEIVEMRENLIPDVSLGTHFFNDMVEWNMFYLALFPNREENFLDRDRLSRAPNHLTDYLPDAGKWGNAVKVIHACDLAEQHALWFHANVFEQRALCYLEKNANTLDDGP